MPCYYISANIIIFLLNLLSSRWMWVKEMHDLSLPYIWMFLKFLTSSKILFSFLKIILSLNHCLIYPVIPLTSFSLILYHIVFQLFFIVLKGITSSFLSTIHFGLVGDKHGVLSYWSHLVHNHRLQMVSLV